MLPPTSSSTALVDAERRRRTLLSIPVDVYVPVDGRRRACVAGVRGTHSVTLLFVLWKRRGLKGGVRAYARGGISHSKTIPLVSYLFFLAFSVQLSQQTIPKYKWEPTSPLHFCLSLTISCDCSGSGLYLGCRHAFISGST